MKRNLITLQFIENGLIILNKKEIKEYILKSVNNYQIINKDTFIEEMTLVIEKNKLNNNYAQDIFNCLSSARFGDGYAMHQPHCGQEGICRRQCYYQLQQ